MLFKGAIAILGITTVYKKAFFDSEQAFNKQGISSLLRNLTRSLSSFNFLTFFMGFSVIHSHSLTATVKTWLNAEVNLRNR